MVLTCASFGGVILYSYLRNLLNKSYLTIKEYNQQYRQDSKENMRNSIYRPNKMEYNSNYILFVHFLWLL